MAWSNSHRKDRFNPGWERTRKLILERDHHQCQRWITDVDGYTRHKCLAPANEVDHIRRALDGVDDDSPGNLESLCHWHHVQKTANESAEQRKVNRERRKEAAWYSHPAYRRTAS
ncbi:HNH endonuclease [Bifidobacterium olomucense]|uniref:HNH endonuclease n=1 Tax=Bifidobacterium olomucense TaxID=2675324 RepID=A0A7Y0EXY9_9BIFI|nr:HNH endonuclease [Bifidobacterium sp. DSM 109959]NMM98143.1 HNH endonuclease [Bifidobacterium sp. DSM 109959]